MISLHLIEGLPEWLDVWQDDERIGQIAPSDKWAVYRATTHGGMLAERRIATTQTINEAVEALLA